MSKHCPACAEPAIMPSGPKNSPVLIIGEFPGNDEMEHGRPFTGKTGKILRAELRRIGIEFMLCRVTNLWMHLPNGDESCFKAGLDAVLEEAKGRKAILLIGSECADVFLGKGVMEVAGLETESTVLSSDLIMASPNPAMVFQPNQGVGEVRFALQKFADACNERGIFDEETDVS